MARPTQSHHLCLERFAHPSNIVSGKVRVCRCEQLMRRVIPWVLCDRLGAFQNCQLFEPEIGIDGGYACRPRSIVVIYAETRSIHGSVVSSSRTEACRPCSASTGWFWACCA